MTRATFVSALFLLSFAACDSGDKPPVIRLDYATYNPVGLLLKDKGYLEDALKKEGVKVEWTKSLGSNKALEFLSGNSIDFGSTAGAAALLSKANGNPIRSIYVYSKPEWTALVTRPETGIDSIEKLKGKKVAVTRGTDPFVFLLRALDSVGLTERDIELVPLQHPDGKLRNDWDNIGQRQTDSGSARFEGVVVTRAEILATPGPLGSTFASLRPCIAQLVLANIYLGLAEGAFDVARTHTRDQGRPWFASGVASAGEDPYVLRHFGELWTELVAARLVTDAAAIELERAWQLGDALEPQQRGAAAIAIAVAKAKTTKVTLETTSRIFEVMGARATTAKARVDRFWRNARVHTLHDPVDYKLRDIGRWALLDEPPVPTFYS